MKDATRSALIAILAISAVAVAAATIESTVVPDASAPGGPDGSGGGDDGGPVQPPETGTSPGETVQIPFLEEILTVLAVLVAIAVLVYLFRYWRTALETLVVFAALGALVYALLALLGSPADPSPPPALEPGIWSPFGDGGGDPDAADQPSLPAVLLLLGLAAALVGTIVAFVKTSPGDDATPDEAGPEESRQRDTEATAVGAAAGRAADRLEREARVDNEVYRAWREMTALLDVPDPDTSTPGEFATAAVEAGMSRDEVSELTRLFEDVRYGDAEPSADRERRAIDVFRRIERRYAEDES